MVVVGLEKRVQQDMDVDCLFYLLYIVIVI